MKPYVFYLLQVSLKTSNDRDTAVLFNRGGSENPFAENREAAAVLAYPGSPMGCLVSDSAAEGACSSDNLRSPLPSDDLAWRNRQLNFWKHAKPEGTCKNESPKCTHGSCHAWSVCRAAAYWERLPKIYILFVLHTESHRTITTTTLIAASSKLGQPAWSATLHELQVARDTPPTESNVVMAKDRLDRFLSPIKKDDSLMNNVR